MSGRAQTEAVDKAAEALALSSPCVLCPRRCRADRAAGERGWCGAGSHATVFRAFLHFGIEYELTPAFSVYLAGCNLRCAFCTAREWNEEPARAAPLDGPALADGMAQAVRDGAKTLLIVGGEPTVSLPAVVELAGRAPEGLTVALDSNLYFSPEVRRILEGIVDVYVADLKFGPGRCADELAQAPDYFRTVTANLEFAEETASLIVRHVLVPDHFDCCFRPALDWMVRNLRAPRLSLRGDYLPPEDDAPGPAPSGYVSDKEYARARAVALHNGIELVE
jgi:putative pyruvate formate lyase activating enzyme